MLSPADVLRRHLNVFSHATVSTALVGFSIEYGVQTGHLPSLKQKRLHKLTERGEDAPYRAADMVKVASLTPDRYAPETDGRWVSIVLTD